MPQDPAPARPTAGSTFDAVLLDLDGTLVDSGASVERSWRRWARGWGVPEGFDLVHGTPARQVVARFVAPHDVQRAVADIERIEVEDVAGVLALPGSARALADLPPARVAVVTSGTAPLAAARLAAAGLAAPAVMVTADDVRAGKPDPEPYLLGAARLGVDPRRCLVVEDAPAGLAAGRAAGCATLALTTTYPAAELDADLVVATLADVRFVPGPGGIRLAPRPVQRPGAPPSR